jgi:hypothetical protein
VFEVVKMKKDKLLVFGVTTVQEDNNGMLSISTKLRDHRPKE